MTGTEVFLFHLVVAFFAGLLIWAAASDFRRYTIPNSISFAIAGLYPAYVLSATNSGIAVDWLASLVVAAAAFFVGVILFVLRLVGGGDVKLFAAVSLWAGTSYFMMFLVTTAIAGGLLSAMVVFAVRLARPMPSFSRAVLATSPDMASNPDREETGREKEGKTGMNAGADPQEGAGTSGTDQEMEGEAIGKKPVPYGVAIALGGLYVASALLSAGAGKMPM